VVRELILDTIRRVSTYAKDNEAAFLEKVREASTIRQEETAVAHRKQIARNEKRIAELDMLFRKVYEDNAIGRLNDDRYGQLSGAYESEQGVLKAQNVTLQAELDTFIKNSVNSANFIELVRRHTDFTELTTPMLNEFVDRVLVYQADKSTGQRVQQVDVNFIGKFDIAAVEAKQSQAETKADEKRLAKKLKDKEYFRQRYLRMKEEKFIKMGLNTSGHSTAAVKRL
jgi:phage regulator Rha-like protein